jgi:hypothetical protein
MTPNPSQGTFRILFDRFAHRVPDPEKPRRSWEAPEDDDRDEEYHFVRRDEAFYWGWSMNAFM